jgi:putative PIN family toxin of toxin-antitoxin system
MISLRLVLDTNIVVSAALKQSGLQRTVLLIALAKPASLYVSAAILAEYEEVLSRRMLKIPRHDRQSTIQLIHNSARVIAPSRSLTGAADPDDNKFLECAEAARADYLITGNLRHFPKFWRSTKVISTRDFISIVAPHLIP